MVQKDSFICNVSLSHGSLEEQLHAAEAREPRRSGNPFLDDDNDDDGAGHEEAGPSSSATAVPGLVFASIPPEASQASTAEGLQSSQETYAQVSMPSSKTPTGHQTTSQQSLRTAPAVEQHGPLAHSAGMSSDAAPASLLGMERQASRQLSGQASSRAGQVSSGAGPTSETMQQSSSGQMLLSPHPLGFPTNQQLTGKQPQTTSLPSQPALLSNEREGAEAAADTAARQYSSMGAGSALDRQASVPFMQEAVPISTPDDRQLMPAAAPSQPNQAQAGAVQKVQALEPPEQGSQTASHSLHCLDARQQGEGIRPGADAQAQSSLEARDITVPLVHTQAALRQAQAGVSASAQGPADRGRAGPALPLQLQGSFPRAPRPTASMPVYAPPSTGDPLPRQGAQQGGSAPRERQAIGLEGMLGSSAPDSDTEEEESTASAQDRQRFMQSLQSPDQGSSRSSNLAKGFGRMRAKAKDMQAKLQAKNAGSPSGPHTRSTQQAPLHGSAEGASRTPTDLDLGKRGRLARDMTLMFAGLKKPTNQ